MFMNTKQLTIIERHGLGSQEEQLLLFFSTLNLMFGSMLLSGVKP